MSDMQCDARLRGLVWCEMEMEIKSAVMRGDVICEEGVLTRCGQGRESFLPVFLDCDDLEPVSLFSFSI